LPRIDLWQDRPFPRDYGITRTNTLGYPNRVEPLATQNLAITFAVNSPSFTANFTNKAWFSRVANTLASPHIEEM